MRTHCVLLDAWVAAGAHDERGRRFISAEVINLFRFGRRPARKTSHPGELPGQAWLPEQATRRRRLRPSGTGGMVYSGSSGNEISRLRPGVTGHFMEPLRRRIAPTAFEAEDGFQQRQGDVEVAV